MNFPKLIKLYEGTGLTDDMIVKGHYAEDAWFMPEIKELSMARPVAAMEDESAIFIRGDAVWQFGNIHWIDKGEITTLTDDVLRGIGRTHSSDRAETISFEER